MYHKLRAYIKPSLEDNVYETKKRVYLVQSISYTDESPWVTLFGTDAVLRKDQVTLMADVGIEDVNGKLIYEGDIVQDLATEEMFSVAYVSGQFVRIGRTQRSVLIDEIQVLKKIHKLLDEDEEAPYEVVGNIYEHNYLLES